MSIEKTRSFMCVAYPDHLSDGWELEIPGLLAYPGWYVFHDHDVDREPHYHFYLVFSNTTTLKYAINVFMNLKKIGFSVHEFTVEPILRIDRSWKYSIHDTEDAQKKGKFLYDPSSRFTFNDFDIGFFSQLSLDQKQKMCDDLADYIIDYGFTNFVEFYDFVRNRLDSTYREIVRSYSSFLKNLISGNYHLWQTRYCRGQVDPQGAEEDPQGAEEDPQGIEEDPQGVEEDPQGLVEKPQGRKRGTMVSGKYRTKKQE